MNMANNPRFFIKVVRYSALLAGVFYGISHKRSLQRQKDEEKKHHAVHERELLIQQAKEAWKRQQEGPKDAGTFDLKFSVRCANCCIAISSHHQPGRPTIRPRKTNRQMGEGGITLDRSLSSTTCYLFHRSHSSIEVLEGSNQLSPTAVAFDEFVMTVLWMCILQLVGARDERSSTVV